MIHIHYTKGPAVLADVSMETYNEVIKLLAEGYEDNYISQTLDVTQGVIDAIRTVNQLKMKRCAFCGDLFDPKGRTRAITCTAEHYLPCIDCGVPVKVNESYANYMKAGGRRCSVCRGKQIGKTRRELPEEIKKDIVARQEATMIERYGQRNPLQVPEIKARVDKTVKERYGVDNLSQSAEIQRRIKENSQRRFGVDHYSNAPEIREHMINGMIAKYGVPVAQQNEMIKAKTRQTNLARYGVENVFQSKEVQQKAKDNCKAKYGVDWPNQRKEHLTDPSKYDLYIEFLDDPRRYIETHYIYSPTAGQLAVDIGLDDATLCGNRLALLNIEDLITHRTTTAEAQLIEFIHQIDSSLEIKQHDRTTLPGRLEIDVLLPQLNIGFECNPTHTHNSTFRDPWGSEPKHYKYHYKKSDLAEKEGVFLFHIFGYEWTHRRAIIESMIRNLLNKNKNVFYARKTTLKEVSAIEAAQFLNDNHRQGSSSSLLRLGLYYSDELVSLMTFGKMRYGIGKLEHQSANDWELVRFCNKLNTSVVGGASKLLKHFIKEYQPSKIVSFSDRAHTRGGLYSTLGFHEVSRSEPGYVWVSLVDDSYYNRVSCQKSNLRKLFHDDSIDVENKTEKEIMMEHGYAQVFDSGVVRWELDL